MTFPPSPHDGTSPRDSFTTGAPKLSSPSTPQHHAPYQAPAPAPIDPTGAADPNRTGRPNAQRPRPPRVRSISDAIPGVRRAVDALLMFGFGILCFVVAGSTGEGWMIVAGIVSIGWGGYIGLTRGSYVMPYFVYAIAILGGIGLLTLL